MRSVHLLSLAVCMLAASCATPVGPPPAADLHEEVRHITVTVKDRNARVETREIPITVFRPQGPGPFPLAIVNHGRGTKEKRAAHRERMRFETLSRYLVSKGFVVLVPTRVGYGPTYGDFDPESPDACRAARMDVVSIAASDQVLAAHEFARTLPFVDASRWVVLGVSMGGLTSVATVWRHPPGLAGGINFSGGTGGRPTDFPEHPCGARQIASVLKTNASQAVASMLWLYWQNDQYWGPDIPGRWHQAWVAGGGNAEFHQLLPVGADGHLGTDIDMDHWVPIADAFFARIGFTKPGAIARPAASGFAHIEQFDKVPGRVEARDGYRKFLAAPKPRAYAVSGNGDWGYATGDWAMGHALGYCQRRGASCRLYAVDDDVVWAPGNQTR